MTDSTRRPAPDAVGDVIAGEPPVPVTVWHVPAAPQGATLSVALAERLIINFTHWHELVLDLTVGEQVACAAPTVERRYARHRPGNLPSDVRPAALIVTGWPAGGIDAGALLGDCAARLRPGGCVAVVFQAAPLTVNQVLIGAARAAGLTYLQHIVAAHELVGLSGPLTGDRKHLPVHTDVLIFASPVRRPVDV